MVLLRQEQQLEACATRRNEKGEKQEENEARTYNNASLGEQPELTPAPANYDNCARSPSSFCDRARFSDTHWHMGVRDAQLGNKVVTP